MMSSLLRVAILASTLTLAPAFIVPGQAGLGRSGQSGRSSRSGVSLSADTARVDELLGLVNQEEKSSLAKARISELHAELSDAGAVRLLTGRMAPPLDDPSLVGNYEVKFFDRSVDGNRDGADDPAPETAEGAEAPKPRGSRRAAMRRVFRMRGSFQHIIGPSELVNYACFTFLGCVSGRVVAKGSLEQLPAAEIREIGASNGTALTEQTARITFQPPRVAVGGFTFEITGAAAQPPVDLCTTYLDERVRLGLASRGGRFVFTRGGKAEEPFADGWREVCDRPLTDGRLVLAAVGLAAGGCVLRPALLGQAAYGGVGVGLGFGATRLGKWAWRRARGAE